MHILYLHQYFATPRGRTGTRSYEFAKRWVAAGHRVTILTSTAQLTEVDLGAKSPRPIHRTNIDGIEVIALNIRYRQSMGFARRVWSFFWFMVWASVSVLFVRDVDIVYASSTPLTIGMPALVGHCIRRRRYVFEVRDPWPAIPIAMGVVSNTLLIRLLRRLEWTIYRYAARVVTVSEGMTDLVRRVAPRGTKVVTIPNGADTEVFTPSIDGSLVRRERNWGTRFVCLHAGAMGRVNGLGCIVRAADRLRDDPDFLFVLLGEGREKRELIAQRDRLNLGNLQILDGLAKNDLAPVLAAADLCLMTVTDVPVLEHNSANKFFDYLSAGRPIALNYSGWQREVLETAGAGLGCTMGDETAFLDNLKAIKADEARRTEMGRNARQLALHRFDRDVLAATALETLVNAVRDVGESR